MDKEELKQIMLDILNDDDFKLELEKVVIDILEKQLGDMVAFKEYMENNIYNK